MVDFVVDTGLDKLLAQINAAAPDRSKASDGSIGDPAHQARESDHNPESPPPPGNPDDQVDARDFTHDPAHGADMGRVTEAIRKSRDRRVSYVIFDRRIFSNRQVGDVPAYTWRPYTGSDPHTGHAHVSVNDLYHDQTQDWEIGIDDVSVADVRLGLAQMLDEMAHRSTPTGRASADDFNTCLQNGGLRVLGEKIDQMQLDVTAIKDAVTAGESLPPADLVEVNRKLDGISQGLAQLLAGERSAAAAMLTSLPVV